MPTRKPIPEALPQDELVLAAIDRAEHHRRPELSPGIPLGIIKDHAGLDAKGWSTLQLRPQIERLEAAKLIHRTKTFGRTVWTLTDAGQCRLAEMLAAGTLQPLPESPQHRKWREAREAARLEIDQLHADVGLLLGEAGDLHDADPQPPSQVWLDLAGRLANACRWLASATYCLREWPEPDDTKADLGHGGVRDFILWSHYRTAPGVSGATETVRTALAANEPAR